MLRFRDEVINIDLDYILNKTMEGSDHSTLVGCASVLYIQGHGINRYPLLRKVGFYMVFIGYHDMI